MATTEQPRAELTPEQQLMIRQAAARLADEFAGTFGRETIERYLRDSQTKLERGARLGTWVPVLVERFTRDRLRALARLDACRNEKPAVLFLCVHNAGRSQMAAGWMRHLAGDRIEVFSGGSDPASTVNPRAVEAMAEVGIDISHEFPKPWTDEIARTADAIITMGCGDACPIFPGTRYEDWVLTDPADQPIEVVRQVRDEIEQRVRALIAELGVEART